MHSSADRAALDARRHAWLVLSLTVGLGPITLKRAVRAAFGVTGAIKLSHAGWGEVEGIGSHRAAQIVKDLPRATREAELVLERCAAAGISVVTPDDDNYPGLMRDLDDAPAVLYVRGTLEPRDLSAVAIVGSRNCTHYGRDQAARFAALLAGAGFTVVSGGARGVDSAGHEGAMRVPHGRTIAVLGCGVDVVYPPENADLFDRIAKAGAIVSHYPPGTPPNQRHFPERNRVISALSRGVLVIEADERSGSLITARVAADDHNRPVLALPGRVDNPLSSGPHKLLKDGAALITSLEDVLEALDGPLPESAYKARRHVPLAATTPPPTPTPAARTSGPQSELSFSPPTPVAAPTPAASAEQTALLTALADHKEAAAELLIQETGLPAAVVLRELTMLTLKGRIKRIDAQTYALRREG